MNLYHYQVEEVLASTKKNAEAQIQLLPIKATLTETLQLPFRNLPLPIKYQNSILLHSTVIHLHSLADYLRKAVFRHAPLPDLLPEEQDVLVAFNSLLHRTLKNSFGEEYGAFVDEILEVNAKAEWFDKSNPYWITHEE